MNRRQGWYLVVAGSIAWVVVLWPLHSLLPMWVEGLPSYVDQLLGILRRACTPPYRVVEIAGRQIPLNIDAYQGSLMTYLDAPVARLWLGGIVDDQYAYRGKGVLLLGVAGLLAYPLFLHVARPAIAALAALLLVTLPAVAVVAISDLQYHVVLLCAIPAILLPLLRFGETRHPAWLVVAAFFGGLSLQTRAEALVWTVAALLAWIALDRRHATLAALRGVPRKGRWALACVAAFAIGAAPVIAMNVLDPDAGLLGFLVRGAAEGVGVPTIAATLLVRLRQFLGFVLLNHFGLYEMRVAHYALAAAAGCALVVTIVVAVRERRWPLALIALAVVLPMSVIANRGPREIHLLPLVIPVVALVATLCARLRPPAGAAVMAGLLGVNLWIGFQTLQRWDAMREAGADTVATLSCPECLATALAPHGGSAFYFTNLGLYEEALWASRGHVCGRDVHHATGFVSRIRSALQHGGAKVFVGFAPSREPRLAVAGRAYERTALLLTTLDEEHAAFTVVPVHDARGRELYRLYVVDPR